MTLPTKVKIVEVSPRDGLQNEKQSLATETKIQLIDALSATGLQAIEATSFVSAKAIPQLQDAEQVFARIDKKPGVAYPVLVPNLQGLERAIAAGAKEIAVFVATSETFSQKNINCSISESMAEYQEVMHAAGEQGLKTRAYLSCVCGCPYEGEVKPEKVAELAAALIDMGAYEVSLGDTIGVGTPGQVQVLVDIISQVVPIDKLAVHFHDTYGQALANIFAALQKGVAVIDASVAGLGGCPYAKGATGNVATEDVVYCLQGLGIETGVDFAKLCEVGHFISQALNRKNNSKAGSAYLAS
jgi:isopropylmalate/homocitrate/citramalate synthase